MTYVPAASKKWAEAAKKLGRDAAAEVQARIDGIKSGQITTPKTAWAHLAHYTRLLSPGTITTICGDPNAGKSLWLMQLLFELHGLCRIGLYMLESDLPQHSIRLYAQLAQDSRLTDDGWIERSNGQVAALKEPHDDAVRSFGYRMSVSPYAEISHAALLEWLKAGVDNGTRVFAIDPVTATQQTKDPWIADKKFIDGARKIIEPANASLLITTHPKKGRGKAMGLDELAGGVAWGRFTDCVLWLERPKEGIPVRVKTPEGSYVVSANRALKIWKARNGTGTGLRVGYRFENKTLLYKELGIVAKDEDKAKEADGYGPESRKVGDREPDHPQPTQEEDIANLFPPTPSDTPAKPWLERQSRTAPGERP